MQQKKVVGNVLSFQCSFAYKIQSGSSSDCYLLPDEKLTLIGGFQKEQTKWMNKIPKE